MQTTTELTLKAATIRVVYDGESVCFTVLAPVSQNSAGGKGLSLLIAPHEFREMVSALRGIADALRPEASRHYQRLHLNEAIEGSKKLAQDIQNQSDPDANAPWKQSLKDPPPEPSPPLRAGLRRKKKLDKKSPPLTRVFCP